MKLTVGIGLATYDSPCLYLTDDENTVIDVSVPKYSGRFYFIGELNGYHFKKEITNGMLVFKKGQLTDGELHAEIVHLYKAVRINTYKVEPLIVTSLSDGDFHSAVEEKVKELDERVKTLERKKIIK